MLLGLTVAQRCRLRAQRALLPLARPDQLGQWDLSFGS